MRTATLLALAGCFSQPRAPARSDALAPGGDGASGDGGAPGMPCPAGYGPWDTTPTAITLTLATGASARDPWLSDDRNTVYFTNQSTTNAYTIQRATRTGGSWSAPQMISLGSVAQTSSPFLADDGTLWFHESASSTPQLCFAAPDGSGGFTSPIQVMAGREPWLSSSGNILYYTAAAVSEVYRSTRSGQGTFDMGVMIVPGTSPISTPSWFADGTLYVTESMPEGERIYQGTIDQSNTLVGEQVVGSFQTESGAGYASANISRDGKTLVFAYRKASATVSTLEYVTRSCL